MNPIPDFILESDSFTQMLVLAVVQGITEFMPISSSGHLVLVPILTGWADQGLVMDIAVHVGTLIAITAWLHREVVDLVLGLWDILTGNFSSKRSHIVYAVMLASIPLFGVGYWLHTVGLTALRGVQVIAWSSIVGGILLWLLDAYCPRLSRLEHMSWRRILIIGCIQVFALIPGVSRSGAVITGARLLGMERTHAARFSFLLALPAIFGAGALAGYDLWSSGLDMNTHEELSELLKTLSIAASLSAVVALFAVWAMVKWVSEHSYKPFCIYRIVLGIALLYHFGL